MSKSERDEQVKFLILLRQEFPDKEWRETKDFADELMRRGRRACRLAEAACGELTPRQEALDAANDRHIEDLCRAFGVGVKIQGDPRGFTVKLLLPSGRYNTWGGQEEGFGVPGS